MKKTLLTIVMFSACALVSCKKGSDDAATTASVTSTNNIKAPTGFIWANSRNLNFIINVTDTRFPKTASVISIYDADPNNGGNLLAKGSGITTAAFKTKLYIANQVTQVYIVKTSPDNNNIILAVAIGTADITTSIGI